MDRSARNVRFSETTTIANWLLPHVKTPQYRFRVLLQAALSDMHMGQYSHADKYLVPLIHALLRRVAYNHDRADQLGLKRRIALTLPFFVPAIFAIAQTDLTLTVPRRLAKITAAMAGVRVVEAPREIKSFPYFMASHPRLTSEPAHKWLHEQLRSAIRIA